MAFCNGAGWGMGSFPAGAVNPNDTDDQTLSLVDGVLSIENGGPGVDITVDGTVIGSTLVLNRPGGGTVNIPLIGPNSAIDFSTLSPTQRDALTQALRGSGLCSIDGTLLGYLLN